MSFQIKHSELCEIIWMRRERSNDKAQISDFVLEKLKTKYSFTENEVPSIRRHLITNFLTQYNTKWRSASRRREYFKSKYADFLGRNFIVHFSEPSTSNSDVVANNTPLNESVFASETSQRGRPCLSFNDGSLKTKSRRATELASIHSKEELIMALQIKEKRFGTDFNVDEEVEENENENAEKTIEINKYGICNILAMYMDAKLTKNSYEKLRVHNKKIYGTTHYPPYYVLAKAKAKCYPEHIEATDFGASVELISLLDHTLQRILTTLDEKELKTAKNKTLTFLGKWGMDGASAQQTTRQQWSLKPNTSFNLLEDITVNNVEMIPSDGTVFITTFVPIQLRAEDRILWTNKTPCSIFYCRPINFHFVKETNTVIKKNYRYYSKILDKVQIYNLKFKEMSFDVRFDLKCTMIDGKVGNVLTDQKSSASCNICGVSPKNINNIPFVLNLPCKTEFYKFGFPVLHSWIRFMEYFLHVAYNLDFKEGAARGHNKKLKRERKKKLQASLMNVLNLSVDIVKQGSGTSNTGNVARNFFEKADEVSKIIEIDKDLLMETKTILQVISCGKEIDLDKFKNYCLDITKKCIGLYPWYKMPPSVHKVLVHGCDIMKELNDPMIWFSEEPQEANNKVFRYARIGHSRMFQRSETNKDIIHHQLITSDPVITSLRETEKKKSKELSPEAKQFLKNNYTFEGQEKVKK